MRDATAMLLWCLIVAGCVAAGAHSGLMDSGVAASRDAMVDATSRTGTVEASAEAHVQARVDAAVQTAVDAAAVKLTAVVNARLAEFRTELNAGRDAVGQDQQHAGGDAKWTQGAPPWVMAVAILGALAAGVAIVIAVLVGYRKLVVEIRQSAYEPGKKRWIERQCEPQQRSGGMPT